MAHSSVPLFFCPAPLPHSSARTYPYLFHYALLQVIAKTAELGGLSLTRVDSNGQPMTVTLTNSNWQSIAGTEYSSGVFSVLNDATYTLQHSDPTVRFMALLYGSADRESFYFPIDVGMTNINVSALFWCLCIYVSALLSCLCLSDGLIVEPKQMLQMYLFTFIMLLYIHCTLQFVSIMSSLT